MTSSDDHNDERRLKEQSLAFFGAITASVSHELNNVVSIIEQTAGLLEDLLYGATQGRPIENERLQRIAEGITQQTTRGVGIIGRFNFFAHTVDHPITEFELNKTLDNLVGLCARFADMKRVSLTVKPTAENVSMHGSPFDIQQVLFIYIKRMLETASRDDTITVSAEADDGTARLMVEGPKGEPLAGFDDEYVKLLTGRVKGDLSLTDSGERMTVQLVVPRSLT